MYTDTHTWYPITQACHFFSDGLTAVKILTSEDRRGETRWVETKSKGRKGRQQERRKRRTVKRKKKKTQQLVREEEDMSWKTFHPNKLVPPSKPGLYPPVSLSDWTNITVPAYYIHRHNWDQVSFYFILLKWKKMLPFTFSLEIIHLEKADFFTGWKWNPECAK